MSRIFRLLAMHTALFSRPTVHRPFAVRPLRALLVVVVGFLLVPARSRATSIAVVRTPTDITIAADSLVTVADNDGVRQVQSSKLHQAGGLYFTAAGVTLDEMTGLNTTRTGAEVLAGPGTIGEKAWEVGQQLRSPLLRSFQIRQRTMPAADYADFMASSDSALDFVIAGFSGRTPVVALISFRRVDDRRGRPIAIEPSVRMCPGKGCGSGTWYFILGYNREARSQYESAKFWTADTPTVARRIVQLEAAAQPEHVGGPIDVLRIERQGAFWVAPYGLGRRPHATTATAAPPRYEASSAGRQAVSAVPTQR